LRWSFPIGRLFGIPIRVHATFPLLFLVVAAWVGASGSAREAGWATVTILLLFACVVLHEVGHSVVAERMGCHVRDITLLPIGGMARMERLPQDAASELLITAAGPLVSFAIALALAGLMLAGVAEPRMLDPTAPHLVSNLCWLNVGIGIFNLLPAFPMDGGRILRALLSLVLNRVWATRIATWIGRLLAAVMVLAGILLVNPWLAVIGVFVWIGGAAEGRMVEIEDALARVPAGSAAIRKFLLLAEDERLGEASRIAGEGFQQDFPVMARGAGLAGVLDRQALREGLRRLGADGRVGDAAVPALTGRQEEPLLDLYHRMSAAGAQAAVLVDAAGRPCGLVTAEQVHGALLAGRGTGRPEPPTMTTESAPEPPAGEATSTFRPFPGE